MPAHDLVINKATVHHYLDEAWNKGNVEIIDDLMAASYVRYTPTAQLDREGQKRRISDFRQALPDLRLDVDHILAEDDLVAFRVIIRGTHLGLLQGVTATGKAITITATDIVRFANGKIVEHWGNMDELGLLRQLGALTDHG